MRRASSLSTVPIQDLVEELKRRFAAIEKAKKELLADGLQRVGVRDVSGREHVLWSRKRGGTSEYARAKSSLVQRIRHAEDRKDAPRKIAALKKELAALEQRHKG